jgi:uncharacterized membrane protein YoaK (UPF0700 family)
MPIQFLRRLSGRRRTTKANQHLGMALSFVAGAVNAGGFLAVHQYTSHMTGIVSSIADMLALGNVAMAFAGFGAFIAFFLGAACSAMLINWARRKRLQSQYALALLLEATLLLCFGLLGGKLAPPTGFLVSGTVILLCFIMGLQNAIITKISRADIRTTHITGLLTDIGIELGKLSYWNMGGDSLRAASVMANRPKLIVLTKILAMFFIGAIIGAMSFKHVGFSSIIPLAALLLFFASVPVLDDVRLHQRRRARLR